MSHELLKEFDFLQSYTYNPSMRTFISNKNHIDADIDEFLQITYTLDNFYIPYTITTGFSICLSNRRKK
ncbi:MAG: hypothetical protein ACNI3C_00020 [Candidatus Marinarcus sp.]|uniref:hypothetical protein n=1 Tax=Candidatus Marinarcus sp. TaxID=3100987 RepID=UPI003B006D1A